MALIKLIYITRHVCETWIPLAAIKFQWAIFRIKVIVKVTKSLTLVSYEGITVEYAYQI